MCHPKTWVPSDIEIIRNVVLESAEEIDNTFDFADHYATPLNKFCDILYLNIKWFPYEHKGIFFSLDEVTQFFRIAAKDTLFEGWVIEFICEKAFIKFNERV